MKRKQITENTSRTTLDTFQIDVNNDKKEKEEEKRETINRTKKMTKQN